MLRRLKDEGWTVSSTKGSHRQLTHETKPGTVTVSGHESQDAHPKTLRSVWRQAGLEDES
ncbi:MAG: type II toxin-antitoxin system HicA family toxin [Fimbriimonadaceae bacterium]